MRGEIQNYIEIIKNFSTPLSPIPTGENTQAELNAPVKAILFDVYGTLFISGSGDIGSATESFHPESFYKTLNKHGVNLANFEGAEIGFNLFSSAIEDSHFQSRQKGVDFPEVDIREIWRYVFQGLTDKNLIENIPDNFILNKIAVEYECRTNPVWPMPGVYDVLTRIAQNNIPLGIVSNAQFFTPLLFPAFFNNSLPDIGFTDECCIWSFECGHGKPSLLLHEKAIEALESQFGIGPEDTIYVGNDMLNDVFTAHSAGFKTLLFAGDKRSLRLREGDSRCAGMQPDAVIDDLRQLYDLI